MDKINIAMPSDLKSSSNGGSVSYAYCSGLRELKDVIETLDTGDSRTIELENQELSLDELTFSDGKLLNKTYVVRTNPAGSKITGRPNDDNKVAFVLEIEIIKWVNEIDYITKQTYYEANNYDLYSRFCTAGVWTEWQTADSDKYDAAGANLGLVKSGGDVNISDGVITLKDGIITNDKIGNVSADKIVGGTIDGSQVDIININMSNASGSIGGSSIENGSITSDKLSDDISESIIEANNNANEALNKAEHAESLANSAQMTANSKNKVYYQPTVPMEAKTNDIWFNTAKDNQMSVFNGTDWVVEQFGAEAIGNNAISADKIAEEVNSKLDTAFENAENALGDALDALNSANQANTVIADWCYDNDITYINGGNIYTGSITSKQIAANTITANEIATGTITANQMLAGTITAQSGILAEACILEAYIADAAITSAKIADAVIGTAHISDLSVTNAKLADLAVTNAKIADATIESAKIVSLDAGKITTGYLSADRIEAGSLSIYKFDTETRTMVDDAIKTSSEALGTATANGERLDWVAQEVETNTMSITATNGEISSLIEKTTKVEADFTALDGEIATITGNMSSLTTNYNEMKATLDGLSLTVGEQTEKITNLEDVDTQLNTTIKEVSDKQTSLETNLDGFKTTVSETYATQESISGIEEKADNAQEMASEAQAAASEFESRIEAAESTITQNAQEIILRATKSEVEQIKEDISSEISNVKSEIKIEYDAAIEVSANAITQSVTELTSRIEDSENAMSSITTSINNTASAVEFNKVTIEAHNGMLGKINEWARLEGAQLELGVSNSDFKTILTNTELGFWEGSTKVAWISNQELNVLKAIIAKSMGVGNLKIIDEEDLGFSFVVE